MKNHPSLLNKQGLPLGICEPFTVLRVAKAVALNEHGYNLLLEQGVKTLLTLAAMRVPVYTMVRVLGSLTVSFHLHLLCFDYQQGHFISTT